MSFGTPYNSVFSQLLAFIVLKIQRIVLASKPKYFMKRMHGINAARASAIRTVYNDLDIW